ncbi:MAG: hypothetical protein ACI9UA_004111 [Pseudoalteromonas tetraodonis]|jgi:hypothetical protein
MVLPLRIRWDSLSKKYLGKTKEIRKRFLKEIVGRYFGLQEPLKHLLTSWGEVFPAWRHPRSAGNSTRHFKHRLRPEIQQRCRHLMAAEWLAAPG